MKPEDDKRKKLPVKETLKRRWEEFNARLFEHSSKVIRTFDSLSEVERQRYVERFSITTCIGFACILSSFFYWFLPPVVRVLVVPIFIGSAWWAGARIAPKLITPEGRERFIQSFNIVETQQLFEAIMFTSYSSVFAALPLVFAPHQFVVLMHDASIRTLFLSLFTWILIGAPLFVLSKTIQARVTIIVIFSAPAAVLVWSLVLDLLYRS